VTELPEAIGVVGAGTMGAGIAQLGVFGGFETYLHDPFPEALERGEAYVRKGLAKWELGDERLHVTGSLEDLSECGLIIEAVPERLELKRELFAKFEGPVLATNTSSILVTSIASAAARPEDVVGMHFFNPPPLMKLVEVIAADQTGDRALGVARGVAERMERVPIAASDGPGFLVNRCNRPFGAEALRLLQERIATPEQIDRIVRMAGGFRMGPFELMDLVGIDVGFEVAKSFHEQSFGEPRWKPNPLQARKVAAGHLGRKSGRGWYEYPPGRPEDPEPPPVGGGSGSVAIAGEGRMWDELRERARAAGFDVRDADAGLTIGEGGDAVLCAGRSLGDRAPCGFHLIAPIGNLVELTGESEAVESFFRACGLHTEWVGDAPGLVLGRIVAQLVNEARFAMIEGVGSEADIDAGLKLGMNHPRGPSEWDHDQARAVLEGLWRERREERYRPAP
jgi:3-hydroxybutyryl-CoA dehydrogenase